MNHTTLTLLVSFLCACLVNGVRFSSNNNNNADPVVPGDIQTLRAMCQSYCSGNNPKPCPPECREAYIEPWNTKKRSMGIDGLTFDDYLFLRLMGRDSMRGRK